MQQQQQPEEALHTREGLRAVNDAVDALLDVGHRPQYVADFLLVQLHTNKFRVLRNGDVDQQQVRLVNSSRVSTKEKAQKRSHLTVACNEIKHSVLLSED